LTDYDQRDRDAEKHAQVSHLPVAALPGVIPSSLVSGHLSAGLLARRAADGSLLGLLPRAAAPCAVPADQPARGSRATAA
jgi:hypothetical protein